MFSADHSHHDRPRSPGPTAVGSLVERWSRLCLFVSATCLLVQPLGGCQIGSANCTSNSDCTDGRTCIDGGGVFWRGGRCVATCSTAGATDQCPPGRVCTSSGYCAPADAGHLDGGRSDGGADGGRACRPCSLPHARPTCNGGTCEIEACETGWQNKDGAAGNGCECRVRTETCDGVDENCDGTPDDGCDDDGDGFCDAEMTVANTTACRKGGGDCDDDDALTHPGATEYCNAGDQDCDEKFGNDEAEKDWCRKTFGSGATCLGPTESNATAWCCSTASNTCDRESDCTNSADDDSDGDTDCADADCDGAYCAAGRTCQNDTCQPE